MGSVALETPKGRWRRSGGSSVSTVLTSPQLRRRTPKTNCGIRRILEERFDGRLGDVSAVDTGLPAASWWRSRVSPSPAWPFLAPVQEPGGRGSTSTEDHPDSAYSTREGIHWPRVVRTARMPHLPGVPPTLLQ